MIAQMIDRNQTISGEINDDVYKRLTKVENVLSNQTVSIDRCYVINVFVLTLQISKLIVKPYR